jgi:transposase
MSEQSMRVAKMKEIDEKNTYLVEGRYIVLKRRYYLASSEKTALPKSPKRRNNNKKTPKDKRVLKPSERYPNAEIVDLDVEIKGKNTCDCCNSEMEDTGPTDVSEQVTVIPKKFLIERHHHKVYKCRSCDSLLTTPRVPRIKEGSSYSDEMIIDVGMSKYCDLMPMERYAAMAAREGMEKLPANSLIELTHYLAYFCLPIAKKIELEVLKSRILYADETPHRMMEQENKKQWYLWGFSSATSAYYNCHPSRSGDIAASFLKNSSCEFLMSDVYSGYNKGVRLANEARVQELVGGGMTEEQAKSKVKLITKTYCNAHARRKFKELEEDNPEAKFFLRLYQRIYFLEKLIQENKLPCRDPKDRQGFYMKVMKRKAELVQSQSLKRSGIHTACSYFLKNFEELSFFTKNTELPLDNNHQERLLRSPVIGRKTWFGTHSILGGQTAAVLFTIVESCKLNKINPRKYLKENIHRIHQGKQIFTPWEETQQTSSQGSPPQKIN